MGSRNTQAHRNTSGSTSSTMIPSLVNLASGGTSLVRGVPGSAGAASSESLRAEQSVQIRSRSIAAFLTLQIAAGAVLGIAAPVLLIVAAIIYVARVLLLGTARHGA